MENNNQQDKKEVSAMEIMIKVKHYVCNKCGHTWQPRPGATDYPRMCPGCKSIKWDKQSVKIIDAN